MYHNILQPRVVLLVDDENAIRKMVRMILERAGYIVLDAENGKEGLDLCQSHPGPIDLLLSDIIMPELGGRELAEGALKLRPHLKIVFMSGYHEDTLLNGAVRMSAAFLRKPFTPQDLAVTVSATLSL